MIAQSIVYDPEQCPECGERYNHVLHAGKPGTIYGVPCNVIDMDHPTLRCPDQHTWDGEARA